MEWQPIETAPTDGTRILLSNPTHPALTLRVVIGYYDPDSYSKRPRPYWSIEGIRSVSGQRLYRPTHWMYLPALPGEENPFE